MNNIIIPFRANLLESDSSPYSNTMSLLFDGMDDYVDCGNDTNLQFSSSFTISLWCKISDTGTNMMLSKDNSAFIGEGYHLDIQNGTKIRAWAWNANQLLSATGLTYNVWHNIMFIFESTGGANGNQYLYIDGALASNNSITNFQAATVKNLRIGSAEIFSNYTAGNIDEVSLYDKVLTPSEIATVSTAPTVDLTDLSPISWYRFEEGMGTTAIDSGSGGNDGTLINGPTYQMDVP